MKLKFTLSFILFTILGFNFGNAQDVNTFTITSPMSVAGEYEASAASGWGAVIPDGASVSLQLLNDNEATTTDACDGTINPFDNKWAFIDRGNCEFGTKALNAENAGAIGVLICNNVDGDGFPGLGAGADGASVTIPVFGMTKEDCDIIRVAISETEFIDGTLDFVFEPCEDDVVYPMETVWGMNGEGEFDGGLGDWTTEGFTDPAHLWEWDLDGINPSWPNRLTAEAAESACNGVAHFNYWAYNWNGSDLVGDAAGYLTSPTIDLTDADFPILRFSQANLPLNSVNIGGVGGPGQAGSAIQYSIDDGASWLDPIAAPTGNVLTNMEEVIVGLETLEIPIDQAANQSNVRVRFVANGDAYFYMIDDVTIISAQTFGVRTNSNFAAGAQNFRTPVSQVDDLAFLIDVENTGNSTVNNASVNVTVRDGIDILHTQDLSFGDIAGGFLDENKAFPETFAIPAEVSDRMSITYTLTADNDEDDTDNEHRIDFEITEDTYAKVLPAVEGGQVGGIFINGQSFWSVGNYYYVPNGEGYYVKDLRFGLGLDGSEAFSGFINFRLYRWDDLDDDGEVDEFEKEIVGRQDTIVTNAFGLDYSDMELNLRPEDFTTSVIELENDAHYIIVAHLTPNNAATDPIYSVNATGDENTNYKYNYSAMNLARDTLGLSSRYAGFLGTGDDGTDTESRVLTPFFNFSVYMPMTIGDLASLSTEDLNEEVKISAYPNPASDILTVDLSLEEVSENVEIQLIGLNGQLVHRTAVKNVQRDQLNVNVSNMAPGLYILNVRTDLGINTQKILIGK